MQPHGSLIYAANNGDHSVAIINTSDNSVVAMISVLDSFYDISPPISKNNNTLIAKTFFRGKKQMLQGFSEGIHFRLYFD